MFVVVKIAFIRGKLSTVRSKPSTCVLDLCFSTIFDAFLDLNFQGDPVATPLKKESSCKSLDRFRVNESVFDSVVRGFSHIDSPIRERFAVINETGTRSG